MDYQKILKDTGFSKKEINELLIALKEDKEEEFISLLLKKREFLLKSIHKSEDKIIGLDYLLFKLKRR